MANRFVIKSADGRYIQDIDSDLEGGCPVVLTKEFENALAEELFSVSRDEIGALVEAVSNAKHRDIFHQYLRTQKGRTLLGKSCAGAGRVERSRLQQHKRLPPNSPREDELEQGV